MGRYISLCLFLVLIFQLQHQVTIQAEPKISYSLNDAINDLAIFCPPSKVVINTAVKLWHLFTDIRAKVKSNSNLTMFVDGLMNMDKNLDTVEVKLDHIHDHLDKISDGVKGVHDLISEKVINNLPQEFSLDNKLVTIYQEISKVDILFKKFLKYSDPANHFQDDTLLNFAAKVVDHSFAELPSILEQIHEMLLEKSSGVNILTILANKQLSTSMMCKRKQSSQHFLSNLYNNIARMEIRGHLMTQFAYSLKQKFNKINYEEELKEAQVEFQKRLSKTILGIKEAMLHASREFWTCDPEDHIRDVTYVKLDPVFQAYIVSEKDANVAKYLKRGVNKCLDSCPERSDSTDLCRTKHCKKQGNQCSGYLRDCKSPDKQMKLCLADKDSNRRYEYIQYIKKNQIMGKEKSCSADKTIVLKNNKHLLKECEHCLCTCESKKLDMDRYFSLREVTSDVNDNKIVTGVKLAKKNNIIHIQVQQGQLLKNGKVNESTIEWKPIENFSINDKNIVLGKDYHNITWEERTVHLNDMDAPTNNLLTGLKFELENKALKLGIQMTPFDFSTGELTKNKAEWLSNSYEVDKRTELKLDDLELPTTSHSNVPKSNGNEYFKFTISSMKSDVGQTVVPFIDIQEITESPAFLLSGASLVHKGDSKSAGFLALKLHTYNFAPHLQS